ncbi:hypothetical protein [Blastococcus sp. TF02A-35]|uniref:hypothetical protein n=1 Tax=Blastococcus sp. TF02A-35 TaxID=2559612 RepID=UPI001074772C|nr:hypothetical protein [Blastococcus sp. TF02A_35]TFV50294.1 hypothetical protein E4P43_11640 [Blastococcus sp. TF02A_35]
MSGPLPPRVRFAHDHGGGVPVWTDMGTLGADELAGVGVPVALIERLVEWNDRVWPVWNARVPRPVEPGWDREERRLVAELQNQLPDVDVVMAESDEERPAVEADRPAALTVMAAPSVDVPLWSFPFGRSLAVDPAPLFVSEELVEQLRRWNRRAPRPSVLDPRWCADGLVLARALQDELWDVEVFYYEDDDRNPVRGRRR